MKTASVALFVLVAGCATQAFSPVSVASGVSSPDAPEKNVCSDTECPYPRVAKPLEPCPGDMVHVSGEYCPRVEQTCVAWLDTDKSPTSNSGIGPMRCAEFKSPTKCLSDKRVHKNFCIDTYENPNKKGAIPPVDISWYSAKASCESIGKRLCGDSEWTFACEGEEMRPYPYGDGFHRNEETCDQKHESMDPSLPRSRWPEFNHAHPSGALPGCKSSFGVFDQIANVDEWVVNESGHPYASGLKGGYWTYKVRTRCRPMTEAHGPTHSFYQQGFRCCKDTK